MLNWDIIYNFLNNRKVIFVDSLKRPDQAVIPNISKNQFPLRYAINEERWTHTWGYVWRYKKVLKDVQCSYISLSRYLGSPLWSSLRIPSIPRVSLLSPAINRTHPLNGFNKVASTAVLNNIAKSKLSQQKWGMRSVLKRLILVFIVENLLSVNLSILVLENMSYHILFSKKVCLQLNFRNRQRLCRL